MFAENTVCVIGFKFYMGFHDRSETAVHHNAVKYLNVCMNRKLSVEGLWLAEGVTSPNSHDFT